MPTYLYECSSCHQQFEADQRITADPLDTCLCGSKGTVKRLIQPTAILFKGSGFYVNDSQRTPPATVDTATPAPESGSSPPAQDSPVTQGASPVDGASPSTPKAPPASSEPQSLPKQPES